MKRSTMWVALGLGLCVACSDDKTDTDESNDAAGASGASSMDSSGSSSSAGAGSTGADESSDDGQPSTTGAASGAGSDSNDQGPADANTDDAQVSDNANTDDAQVSDDSTSATDNAPAIDDGTSDEPAADDADDSDDAASQSPMDGMGTAGDSDDATGSGGSGNADDMNDAGGSGAGGSGAGGSGGDDTPLDSVSDDGSMSFFVSSVGGPDGGNLGGLDGADALCVQLASAASAELGTKPWRAYLSTLNEDARDRIGSGPWRNANGEIVASDVDELHDQDMGALDATWPPADLGVALTESGEEVVNMVHDILTGTMVDGTWDEARDCNGWTSNSSDAEATVGHSNRDGGGRPPYFNATHQVGCAPTTDNYESGTISAGGGRGSIYCFVNIVD